ncbi:hypothetical protein WJX73_010715 [Symbiochloris irregularis]|uniref:protein-tyrosine-phosphatase n=1 Tax=Symbiochloris irregularis TaxID=706552 RepID=A0AAW1PRU2_9CHLO
MRASVNLSVGSSAQVAEVLPGRLYFACIRNPEAFKTTDLATQCKCFNSETELVYEPFASDFGPLNMGNTFRFCQRITVLLQEAAQSGRPVCYCCGTAATRRSNAAVLIGAYLVLVLGWSADQAWQIVCSVAPFALFRDASNLPSTFQLTVEDCIKGLAKARDTGLLDWQQSPCTWNLAEYEFYEQVENGDLNWIIPGKFLAFSGPQGVARYFCGFRAKQPEDYWDYFRSRNVTGIVRLNNKVYESNRFTNGGFNHYELYFPDGTTPSEAILNMFLRVAESEPGALAVHCKAGLGRTGLLLCSYMMKHYGFTAHEAIGYIRICRPGSVIGCQQQWLEDHEAAMHAAGRLMRKQLSHQALTTKRPSFNLTADCRASAPSALIKSHSGAGSMAPSTPPLGARRSIEVALSQTSSKGAPLLARAPSNKSQASSGSRSQSDAMAESGEGAGDISPKDTGSSASSRLTAYLRSKTPSFKGLGSRTTGVAPSTPSQQLLPSAPVIPPPTPLAKTRSGGQVKLLAPNGQPRKLPAALLQAGQEALALYAADEEPAATTASTPRTEWKQAAGATTRSMAKKLQCDETFSPLGSALAQRA